ncbi:MAG: hypothetical protein L0K65_02915, partial [Actinomyces sp.]|nr:hypothetical protein [Actinomyces sp.]
MRRHLLSAVLALTLVVGLSACDAEPLAAPSQSPSPTPAVSWSERQVADEVTIAQAAPGWENIPGIFT